MRQDLPRGLQAAQVVHAAGETGGEKAWGAHAVVLTVPDERAIRRLSLRLAEEGVPHARVVESDAPFTGQVMALGIYPRERSTLKRHFASLPLLK